MSVQVRTHWKLAKESVRQNRGRSFLTCLGIAIGVASIVLIMSLMGSIDHVIQSQVKEMGEDLLVVRPATHKGTVEKLVDEMTSANQYLKSNLTLKDVGLISEMQEVSAVTPIAGEIATLRADEKRVDSAMVVGVSADLLEIQSLKLKSGMFLNSNVQNSAVVGQDLSLKLFGTTSEAVGKTFTMFDQKFIVVGILSRAEDPINFSNVDFDNAMLINATKLAEIDESMQIQQINVKAKSVDALPTIAKNVTAMIKSEKNGDTNFSVTYGTDITHPADSLFMVMSGMLTLVAGISLIVGGIGVMNIMLVSVAERTREIGIRKAVGASGVNILLQFAFEAMILSISGGMLGLVLGYICAFLISIVTPFAPFISWEILGLTGLIAVAIGVAFGTYPAIKAANKNPIESLRYYR